MARVIDRTLMTELKRQTGKSLPAIYKMIKRKQAQHGNLITRDEAAIVLAGELGIDVSRIVASEELQKVRTVITEAPAARATRSKKAGGDKPSSGIVIDVSRGLRFEEPILPNRLSKEAERMAGVYPVIYVFENSVRNLSMHVLEKEYGSDGWVEHVSSPIRKKVKQRKDQEERKRWHGARNAHEIFYTDMGDLEKIITANWEVFKPILEDQAWVRTHLSSIEPSRNVIAHNNPLGQKDIRRIKVYFDDWVSQIKGYTAENSTS